MSGRRPREPLHLAHSSPEEHKEDLAGIIVKGIQTRSSAP
jgi:hypothetical protein